MSVHVYINVIILFIMRLELLRLGPDRAMAKNMLLVKSILLVLSAELVKSEGEGMQSNSATFRSCGISLV